ncbi:uridine kinase [Fluviispira multicolorata]|uniref:uridine/cytidine kinase n=1 Tax=Fluviispira multicolorata TaxID=2654512 RepID=A0A833JDJ3_9BACT|nr:uridine kinase [Fluviispira multicolorata]KAB8028541.1 uridine kinase [Fluviispira multicolorata]
MWQKHAYKLHSLEHKVREAKGISHTGESGISQPYVIGVCGGSGSGKTTFCRQLVNFLGKDHVLHISQDAYYKDLTHLSFEQRQHVNFDHPDIIEFSLLVSHLDELAIGKCVTLPMYDFAKHCRLIGSQIITPKPIVLVEGVLLFNDSDTEKRINHKIFIDAPEQVRFERRLKRDVRERGRTPESVQNQFKATVSPMHNIYVEPGKDKADLIVSGEHSFEPVIAELSLKVLREIWAN